MNILDKYIGKIVFNSTLLVLVVMISLFSFINFVGELNVIGRENYDLLAATKYLVFLMPGVAYKMFPLAALLGSLIGLGIMASNNELTIIRAAGVSIQRIVLSIMKVAALLMVACIFLGEFGATGSEQYAKEIRATALKKNLAYKTKNGLWTRDKNKVINVRAVLSEDEFKGVTIYEFDKANGLKEVTIAESAKLTDNVWDMTNIERQKITSEKVSFEEIKELEWTSFLRTEVLDVLVSKPDELSSVGLYHYIQYLKKNGLNAGLYELEMWRKIMLPFATVVMVFLAVPFVFGPLRSVGAGQRIMVGTMVGITFYIFNQILGQVGFVYHLNPAFCAIFPTVLVLTFTIFWLRKIS